MIALPWDVTRDSQFVADGEIDGKDTNGGGSSVWDSGTGWTTVLGRLGRKNPARERIEIEHEGQKIKARSEGIYGSWGGGLREFCKPAENVRNKKGNNVKVDWICICEMSNFERNTLC